MCLVMCKKLKYSRRKLTSGIRFSGITLFSYTIPISAPKHTYQLRGMASTLRMRTTVSSGRIRAVATMDNRPLALGYAMLMSPDETAAATAGVIWLCAYVRYWPYRGVSAPCSSVLKLVFFILRNCF